MQAKNPIMTSQEPNLSKSGTNRSIIIIGALFFISKSTISVLVYLIFGIVVMLSNLEVILFSR